MSILRRAVYAAASFPKPLREDNGWAWRFRFKSDSAVFAGHFPGHPVLPAVVQLLMAQIALEECGYRVNLTRVPQAKFTAPIKPGDDVVLFLSKGRREDVWECTLSCGTTLAAHFQVENSNL